MLQGTERTNETARSLRKQMTLPEVLLWRVLRTRPAGLKFRRQHPAGHYVLDFYCHEARLAVEVDGIVHGMGDQPSHDAARDAHLRRMGLRIIRLPADQVLRSPEDAASAVTAYANESAD